jgi:hypothetical protein
MPSVGTPQNGALVLTARRLRRLTCERLRHVNPAMEVWNFGVGTEDGCDAVGSEPLCTQLLDKPW